MAERSPNRVFLVGPMGSGKTTLGRRAAEQLGLTFIDCDEEIERRTGASVNLIFDIEGEEGFRARETALLQELSERDGVLVATGGGVIKSQENRRILRDRGFVVWLPTTVNQQLRRLEKDRKRPLLQAPDRRERLEALARERNPLYANVADLTYRSRHRNVIRAAEGLARALNPDRPQERTP
jgi:shikimate kinase